MSSAAAPLSAVTKHWSCYASAWRVRSIQRDRPMMLAASFVSSKSPRFVSASYVFVMGLVLYGDAEQVRTKELKPEVTVC